MKLSVYGSLARTITGLAVFSGLAVFLLALMACLQVPVGDPERSRIDPALSGVWQVDYKGHGSDSLWIIEPWDKRTWVLTVLAMPKDDDESAEESTGNAPNDALSRLERTGPVDVGIFKAWLTKFSGVRFLVLEPKQVVDSETGMKPDIWLAFRVQQSTAESAELRLVVGNGISEAETTAKAEAILRKHARDPSLYGDEAEFYALRRVSDFEYDRVDALLQQLNISTK